jgi:hypothetical protein
MKTKLIITTGIMLLSNCVFSQLKIDQYGRVGIGTNYPSPEYKVHVKGDILLTTYPIIPPNQTRFQELRLKIDNGFPTISSSSGHLWFKCIEIG